MSSLYSKQDKKLLSGFRRYISDVETSKDILEKMYFELSVELNERDLLEKKDTSKENSL